MGTSAFRRRLTLAGSTYVLSLAVVATIGFAAGSTPVILLSALATFPSSVLAVAAYYLAYGLLALVPGANPSSSSGSGSCTSHGDCLTSSATDMATWFTVTSEILGVLALIVAALLNVAVFQWLAARRRERTQARAPGSSP